MRNKKSQKGVVLLLVVVLLTVCCLILTQLSMVSFSAISQSKQRQRDLQRHWSAVSIRRSVLAQADRLWKEKADPEIRYLELEMELGGEQYLLKVENENTKLHVNRVRNELPPQASRDLLSQYLRDLDPSAFRSHSLLDGDVRSWTELTEFRGFDVLNGTDQITLWGNGKLHLWESEIEMVEALWKAQFGRFPPSELIEAREQWPRPGWDDLKSQLGLRDADLSKAETWFTTSNSCFSLEMVSIGDSRQLAYLFVFDGKDNYGYRY